METTKIKRFSKKLLALFLAVVMAITCFAGALSAFASDTAKYSDDAVEYNDLAWAVLSDEQTATALLDYLDSILEEVGPTLSKPIASAVNGLGTSVISYNADTRIISINAVVISATIKVYLNSVDELMETIESLDAAIDDLGSYIGDAGNIQLGATSGMRRSNTSSVDIIKGVLGILQQNLADYNGKDVIGEFLRGGFDLGTVGSLASLDVYDMLKGLFGFSDTSYKSNFVYEIVKALLMNNTNWFSTEEQLAYNGGGTYEAVDENGTKSTVPVAAKTFVFDEVLLEKLNTQFLQKINAEITYNSSSDQTESSKTRYKAIKEYAAANSVTFRAAAGELGYDQDLVYTDDGNVYLFVYGTNDDGSLADDAEKISLNKEDSLFAFGYQALEIAWKTALEPTLNTLRVNYDVDRGHGTNFDNHYYYWAKANLKDGWDTSDLETMYSTANINAWANSVSTETVTQFATGEWVIGSYSTETAALGITTTTDANGDTIYIINDGKTGDNATQVTLAPSDAEVTSTTADGVTTYSITCRHLYEVYSASSADEFLGWVKENYEFDRGLVEGSTGAWSDINPKTLFTKLRYSPLADYGFNMTTGPINLYFMQTGTKNLSAFFDSFTENYDTLVGGINDALVAAVKDIFIDRSVRTNVYGGENAAAYPTLKTTLSQGIATDTTVSSDDISGIVSTFVSNATQVIQYTADAIDSNILKAFYDSNGTSAVLSESNIESAMMPLIIACVSRIQLNGYKLSECIHPEDFDGCKDIEALMFVALREYLSYILPDNDYDKLATVADDGTITATLEGTILPMARDAVSYVMQGYVPVADKDGNAWDVYEDGGLDSAGNLKNTSTIFDLLNSVVAYYGGEYTYTNSSTTTPRSVGAMGVGALIGLCGSTDGRSTITTDVSIWENIDAVANKLLPVLGELQGNGSGNFSSEQLIWNDLVENLVEIGNIQSSKGGASRLLEELLTIISAAPIQSTAVINTVYDLAADLVNGLFGARYDGQGWSTVIPARTSEHPFDDLLQVATVAGTDGSNVGAIQKAICNFVEFAGFGTSGVSTYPDSIIRGLMFALQAVQSFVPSIVQNIGSHTLGMASAQYTDTTATASSGGTAESTISFTNTSVGVNNAYVDSINDKVTPLSRYYMRIISTDAVSPQGGTCKVEGSNSSYLIAPGETVTLSTSSTLTGTTSSVKATITYEICDADGNVLADSSDNKLTGIKAYCYQFLTSEKGWADVVYNRTATAGEETYMNTGLEISYERSGLSVVGPSKSKEVDGYKSYSSSEFRNMFLNYPEYFVITTSNLAAIQNYAIRVVAYNERSVDGFYCYDKKDVYDDNAAATVTVGTTNAIPIFDKETGALIKNGELDILVYKTADDGTKTYYDTTGAAISATKEADAWQRNGTSGGSGYSVSDAANIVSNLADYKVTTRPHVAYTLAEAKAAGIIKAYHFNEAGVCEYVYIQPGSGDYAYDNVLSQISLRGPVDGIYLNQGKMTISGGGTVNSQKSKYTTDLFVYDGETSIAAGEYDVNLCAYNSTTSGFFDNGSCTLVVGDDSQAEALTENFKSIASTLNQYDTSDFTDENIVSTVEEKLYDALSVVAAPVTPTSALELSDETEFVASTETVTTEYGDIAYVPYTSDNENTRPSVADGNTTYQMPITVYADAYYREDDGVWCFDENCTMPIYSPVPLTADDVTDGKDPAGVAVIEGTGDDAGTYYLRNTPVYDMVWDEGTADISPYQKYKLDENGNKIQSSYESGGRTYYLYSQVTYVYRNASGVKVNSDFDWYCKFPATGYKCKTDPDTGSTVNYRGAYTEKNDLLTYWNIQLLAAIDNTIAAQLVLNVSTVRNGMNNNNFDVVTYNKMVELAKKAENNYSFTFNYVKDGVTYTAENVSFSDFTSKYVNKSTLYVDDSNLVIPGLSLDSKGDLQFDFDTITINSSLSSVQVKEYVRLFEIYMGAVVERGYNGVQLEKEIVCATGNAYNTMTAVAATDTSAATVQTTAEAVDYGTIDENGYIVNDIYTEESWTNYINALADAVAMATEANTTYTYVKSGIYKPSDQEKYTCQVTDCYRADTALQVAEIALAIAEEEPAAEGYNVTGSLVIATTSAGATKDCAVNGTYNIAVYDESGTEVANEDFVMSSDNNTFTLTLAPGTYTATISSEYAMTRDDITIIVTNSDITYGSIPIIACDFKTDRTININDVTQVYQQAVGNKDSRFDLNGDGNVNVADAVIVYACSVQTSMDPITIQN